MKSIMVLFLMVAILNHPSAFGATINCLFKTDEWRIVGLLYTCIVNDTGIFNGSRMTIDSIEGEHLTGKTNDNVQAIEMRNISNFNFFPADIEKHFQNLSAILVTISQLQEISSNDLQPFPNLKYLGLSENKIRLIEKNAFKYNPQLRGIWLNKNQISHIDYKAFDGLGHLERLFLSNNKCKNPINDAWIRSEALKRIRQIENGDCYEFNPIIQKAIDTESEKLISKIDELKTQSERVESQLQAQEKINSKKLNDIGVIFTTMLNEVVRKQKEMNQEMNRKIENLEEENRQFKNEVIALKTQDAELHKKIQVDKSELQSQIQALTDENNQMKQVDEQLKAENQAIRKDFNEKLQAQDEINKKKFSESEKKISELVNKMEKKLQEISQKMNEVIAEMNKNMNKNYEQLKAENQAIRNHLAVTTLKAIETIKNVEKLQLTSKIMKDHFVKIQDYDTVYNQLIKSKNQLSAEYRTITETLTDQTKELIRDVTAMKPQIDILKLKINEIQKKHKDIKEEVDQMGRIFIPQIRKDIIDLKKVDQDLTGFDFMLDDSIRELNTTSQEMRIETRTINLEFKALKLKYYEFNDEIVKLQDEKRKLQEKIQAVENQMRNLPEDSNRDSKTDVQNTNSNRVERKGKANEKIEKLNKKVEFLLVEITDLKKCCIKPATQDIDSGEI